MRITAIHLQRLVVPLDPPFPAAWDPEPRTRFPVTLVRVETDEGVVGIGSGDTMDGFEAFEHLFIGQDPLAVARHVRVLETIDFHAGRYWPLEVALWDIVGKVAGLPVATLFGGALDGIPAYASCGSLLAPAARAESALRLREEGFRALKIRIDPRRLDEGLAAVAATRAAVTDTMAIMVDLNQGWRMAGDISPSLGPAEARRIVAQLADYDVLWVEEPLAGTDLRGLAGLRAASPGPRIAGGEMIRTFPEVLAALDADAFDVFQGDVVLSAGHVPDAHGRRAGTRPQPLVHARTPGPTASGCWPTCTSRPASVAGRSSSSRTTRRAGPPSAATRCSPSPSDRVATASCACRAVPGIGITLDESAITRYTA